MLSGGGAAAHVGGPKKRRLRRDRSTVGQVQPLRIDVVLIGGFTKLPVSPGPNWASYDGANGAVGVTRCAAGREA